MGNMLAKILKKWRKPWVNAIHTSTSEIGHQKFQPLFEDNASYPRTCLTKLVINYRHIQASTQARRLFPPRHQWWGRLAYQVNHQGHRHPPIFSFLKWTKMEDKYLRITAKSKDSMPIIKHEYVVAHYHWWESPFSNKPVVCSGIKISRGKNVQSCQLLQHLVSVPSPHSSAGEDLHDSRLHEDCHFYLPPMTTAAQKLLLSTLLFW